MNESYFRTSQRYSHNVEGSKNLVKNSSLEQRKTDFFNSGSINKDRERINRFNGSFFSSKKQMIEKSKDQPHLKYYLQNHKQQNFKKVMKAGNSSKLITRKSKVWKQRKGGIRMKTQTSFEEGGVPFEIMGEVKQVFRNIDILKQMGFTEKLLIKWLAKFFKNRSPLIRDVFLKSHQNKKSLVNAQIIQRETDIKKAVQRIRQILFESFKNELYFISSQARELKRFLQDIIIKLTSKKLEEIQLFHHTASNQKYRINTPKYNSVEGKHFLKDLKALEDSYGELTYVSRLNRVKMSQLQETQEKVNQSYKNNILKKLFIK